jgi:ferredoxin
VSHRLRVNPIACEAHGMCAELLPERVTLDEWGYPVVDSKPLEPALIQHARRAAAACPTLALLIEREPAAASSGERGPT